MITLHRRAMLAWAFAVPSFVHARARDGKTYRVGLLSTGAMRPRFRELDELRTALAAQGYFERRNLVLEARSSEGVAARNAQLAAELVAARPDLIIGSTTPAVLAPAKASQSVPMLMIWMTDPVGSGLVRTLAQPGRNITGIADMQEDLLLKLPEFALAFAPAQPVGLMFSPDNPGKSTLVQREAEKHGARVIACPVRHAAELDSAFAAALRNGVRMMIVLGGPPFNTLRTEIASAALRNGIGTLTVQRRYVEAGALLSYGLKLSTLYSQVADYADRILNGANPAQLPVLQPREFELTINGATAARIGLAIPEAMRINAEIVE